MMNNSLDVLIKMRDDLQEQVIALTYAIDKLQQEQTSYTNNVETGQTETGLSFLIQSKTIPAIEPQSEEITQKDDFDDFDVNKITNKGQGILAF